MSKIHHIIPIFVPHRGCPHDCVFCNQKKITGLTTDVTPYDIKNIIEEFIKTIPQWNKELEVAFFGGSFTSIDLNIQEELLKVVHKYKKKGSIHKIRLSTRPDAIDEEKLRLLKKYGVDIIELGVQSMDETVLKESYRGHTPEDVKNASKIIKDYNFILGLQMMVGLPFDNREKDIYTAKELIKLNPSFVRIYPTLVVKDTYLEKMYIKGTYNPLTIEESVSICTDLLMLFNYYKIPVIRIGLQPTENISLEGEVVAGPFHPSFRQLVEATIYKIVLIEYFSINNNYDNIVIRLNHKNISNFVGQRKQNVNFVKERFNIKNIKILGNNIPEDVIYIKSEDKEDKIVIEDYIEKILRDKGLLID